MLNIYCAGCGETLGKTEDQTVAAAAKDTVYCEDCVDAGVASAEDAEEVESEEEEPEEETDAETVAEEENK